MNNEIYKADFGEERQKDLEYRDFLVFNCQSLIDSCKNNSQVLLDKKSAELQGYFQLNCEKIQNSLESLEDRSKIEVFHRLIENVLIPLANMFKRLDAVLTKIVEKKASMMVLGHSDEEILGDEIVQAGVNALDSLYEVITQDLEKIRKYEQDVSILVDLP